MVLPLASLVTLCVFLLSISVWLVQHYASKGTSILIRLLVTLSFWLGFGGIALLPVDLSLTTSYETDEEKSASSSTSGDANETYLLWMVTYWSTFVLAWTILPLVREVLLSGHFTRISRLRAGCRVAVRSYMILLVLAVVVVILLAIRLRSWHVVPVLMALGNTYGLLLVSLLLGYGLVDLPRRMWRQADPDSELRRTRIMAGAADEALFDAVWELQDCEDLVDSAVLVINRCNGEEKSTEGNALVDSPEEMNYKLCLESLVNRRNATAILSRELQHRRTSQNRRHGHGEVGLSGDEEREAMGSEVRPTLESLVKLNARLQRAQASLASAEQSWNALVERSKFYSDLSIGVVPSSNQSAVPPSDPLLSRANAKLLTVRGRMHSLWIKTLRNPAYRLLAIFNAGLSVMVLWSEATLAAPVNLSPFAFLLRFLKGSGSGTNAILFQIAALIPLLYMSLCTYGSLFKLTIFGPFCLRGEKQSHGVALVFNAQYLVRLQFSLGYNFLLMLKYDTSSTNCAFSHVMSDMSTVPFFGTSFSVYAPLLIIALCCFTLCNGYPRLLAVLGIEHEDAILMGDPETLDGKLNEGITLLRRHVERTDTGSSGADGESQTEPSPKRNSRWYEIV